MSQSQVRKFRRAIQKKAEPDIERIRREVRSRIFVQNFVHPKPFWLPRFIWRKVVALVIKPEESVQA